MHSWQVVGLDAAKSQQQYLQIRAGRGFGVASGCSLLPSPLAELHDAREAALITQVQQILDRSHVISCRHVHPHGQKALARKVTPLRSLHQRAAVPGPLPGTAACSNVCSP